MPSNPLMFANLHERHIGVTERVAHSYSEAACVCLDRHHVSPIEFSIVDNGEVGRAEARWTTTDSRTRIGWGNKDDATRDGAYAMCLAAVELTRGLVAVGRAETRTGADYYLGEPGKTPDDLEASYRLEVSGTDEGNETVINARLRQKLEQSRKGMSNLPAIASVVGFRASQIASADLATEQP
jgi:hypothetical protein